MNARLDRILSKLAQQHVFSLLASLPPDGDRLALLADGLAANGILVLMAQVADQDFDHRVGTWIAGYAALYRLLTETLFPSHRFVHAVYADQERPPVIVLRGDSLPVMRVMAGYIVPYASIRQHNPSVDDKELRTLMAVILNDLEAGNLSQTQIERLHSEGIGLLRYILGAQVHQFSITQPRQPLLDLLRSITTPPPPPEAVPADPTPSHTLTQEMFITEVPLPFETDPPPPPETTRK